MEQQNSEKERENKETFSENIHYPLPIIMHSIFYEKTFQTVFGIENQTKCWSLEPEYKNALKSDCGIPYRFNFIVFVKTPKHFEMDK